LIVDIEIAFLSILLIIGWKHNLVRIVDGEFEDVFAFLLFASLLGPGHLVGVLVRLTFVENLLIEAKAKGGFSVLTRMDLSALVELRLIPLPYETCGVYFFSLTPVLQFVLH